MSSESVSMLPKLAIIHHMARSGGTLISRCLASMENVVLLSEIHPLGVRMFNPLKQADQWYGLLNDNDVETFRSKGPDFVKAIQLVSKKCVEQGKHLILRDWSHLDFTGVPFTRPVFRSRLAEVLNPHFELRRFSTLRHPLDQWLSLTNKMEFRQRLQPSGYLQGVSRFADMAEQTGYLQYEAFTAEPDQALQTACAALGIPFDPGYAERWFEYTNITGDVLPGRAGDRITSLPRQSVEAARCDALTRLPDWQATLHKLGYSS